MKVRDVMSKNVASVNPEASVEDIAKIMKDMNVGSVPVCEGNKVIGIVTDRDIVLRDMAVNNGTKNVQAKEVMTVGLSTVSPDMDVHEAANLMSEKQIRRVPVVEGEELVGIVALGDLAVRSKLEDNAGEALSSISHPTQRF